MVIFWVGRKAVGGKVRSWVQGMLSAIQGVGYE
jgi:hypothetical protein